MKAKYIVQLFGFIVLILFIGGLSGIAAGNSRSEWSNSLNKPFFNPPDYLFGPVWTVLYALMGVSLFLIYNSQKSSDRTRGLWLFSIQIFLNFWWSIIFFSWHNTLAAFIEIILLWLCILWMIVVFKRVKPLAAFLQVPYLLWVSFASILTGAIYFLN